MPFETPRLDDRTFEDLVQEARRRIPLYTPEWTDHNLSDPGITLIELFAWFTDVMLYRMNRIPEKHYIKMMELIGMSLQEPEAANTRVTFWLSAPQPTDVQIPLDTQVATVRTETTPAVIFSTTQSFTVRVAQLSAVLSSEPPKKSGDTRSFREINLKRLESGFEGVGIFSPEPKDGDALYIGFKTDLSHHIVGLDMDVDLAGGAGVDPTNPPYRWQALKSVNPIEWVDCEVDEDGTKGFNVKGIVRVHLPELEEGEISGQRGYWLRVRLLEPAKGVPQYRRSPVIRKMTVGSWGATVSASHASTYKDENLGRSDGSPGQLFYLENTPVLPRRKEERLLVRITNQNEEAWTEVQDFSESTGDDKHYTIDSATGELRFGPVLRQRDGSMKRYGSIPPKGAVIVMKQYRSGGGVNGNLKAGAINIMMTSIPYIARVRNRVPALGGLDRESLQDAQVRLPGYLRSIHRAVTGGDYEYLAMQAVPGLVGRVFALQPPNSSLGEVKVLLIPRIDNPGRFIEVEELVVENVVREQVRAYLDDRRLLTTRLDVTTPAYYWVGTRVRLRVSDHANAEKVKEEATKRLFEFINPITGGLDGKGWTFGRDLHNSDLITALQNVPGIDFIRSVEIFPVTLRDGKATYGDAVPTIETVAHGVMVSYRHDVKTDND